MSSVVRSKASVLAVLAATTTAGLVAVAPAVAGSPSKATISKLHLKLRESRAEKHVLRQSLTRARGRLAELTAVKAAAKTAIGGSGGVRNRLHELEMAIGGRPRSATAQLSTTPAAFSTLSSKVQYMINEIDPAAATLNSAVLDVETTIGAVPGSSVVGELDTIINEIDPASTTLNSAVLDVEITIGAAPGSSVATALGHPTINGTPTSLTAVISGSSSQSLAAQLGDPVTGTGGLSGLIRHGSGTVGTVNGFDTAPFYDAIDLNDQLTAFGQVLDESGAVATSQIEIPKSSSAYVWLASVLANLNHD